MTKAKFTLDEDSGDRGNCCGCSRRVFFKMAFAAGLGLSVGEALADESAAAARPKPGDRFVFVLGDRQGEVIKPEDLSLGGPQLLAYPMDPESKIVRDGSRLNQALLIRLDPGRLTEETRAKAAEGVVAYSAICTHQGCDVSQWKNETETLLCVCHGSEFDPRDRAKVVAGPAPRRLAMLPIKVEEGVLVVAGAFTGRPGFSDM